VETKLYAAESVGQLEYDQETITASVPSPRKVIFYLAPIGKRAMTGLLF
jgi:hypothetical protein